MTARASGANAGNTRARPCLDDGGDLRLDRLRRGRQQAIDALAGLPVRTERDAQLGSGGCVAGEPAIERAVRDHRPVLRRLGAEEPSPEDVGRERSEGIDELLRVVWRRPSRGRSTASSPYIPNAHRSTRRIRSGPARARTSRIHGLPDSSDARAGPLAKAASSATSSKAGPDTIRTGGKPRDAACRRVGWVVAIAPVSAVRRGSRPGAGGRPGPAGRSRSAIRARRRAPGTCVPSWWPARKSIDRTSPVAVSTVAMRSPVLPTMKPIPGAVYRWSLPGMRTRRGAVAVVDVTAGPARTAVRVLPLAGLR